MFSDILVKRLVPEAILPTRAHPEDAAMDLYALETASLAPGEGVGLRTGIAMAIPAGYVGLIADRSSMGKRGLKVMGGVIDAGYRGEIIVMLRNISLEVQEFAIGDRIGQMMIIPIATPAVHEVAELDETMRGEGGFGSTGR